MLDSEQRVLGFGGRASSSVCKSHGSKGTHLVVFLSREVVTLLINPPLSQWLVSKVVSLASVSCCRYRMNRSGLHCRSPSSAAGPIPPLQARASAKPIGRCEALWVLWRPIVTGTWTLHTERSQHHSGLIKYFRTGSLGLWGSCGPVRYFGVGQFCSAGWGSGVSVFVKYYLIQRCL